MSPVLLAILNTGNWLILLHTVNSFTQCSTGQEV